MLTVALAGLGSIGSVIAKGLVDSIPGLELVAAADANEPQARSVLASLGKERVLTSLGELVHADIVVEALPAASFDAIAVPITEAGRTLIPCSVGALLSRPALIERARSTGARIIVPTGAIAGLDAIRALARGAIYDVLLESRKPPRGLAGAPYLEMRQIDVMELREATLVFEGNALEAAQHFPANANVAAALALAGIGPLKTRVQIWADPTISRNIHAIHVDAESARLSMTVENVPSETNPRTSKLAPLSILACLAGLVAPVRIGS